MSLANKPAAGTEGFSPEFRLHYPWEYRKFFGGAEVFRASECLLFRIPNTWGHYRVGITLKSRGNSVARNRVKRRIREAFRRLGPVLGPFDYNVVVPSQKKMDHLYAQRLAKCLAEQVPGLLAAGGRPARAKS